MKRTTSLILALAATVPWVQAQDLLKPKEAEPKAPLNQLPPGAVPQAQSEVAETPFIANLKGLVIVASPDLVKGAGVSGVTGLQVEGPDFLKDPKFEAAMRKYFGQPLTMTALRTKLNVDIIQFCRGKGRPVIDVFVPEQEVINDTLQVAVIEGKVSQVAVENKGHKWVSDDYVRRQIRLDEGDPILEDKLLDDLNWLNRNSYLLDANVALAQGRELGTSAVRVDVQDRFPVSAFVGYENSLVDLLGNDLLLGGANWLNAFGQGHQLNYQYSTDSQMNHLWAHSVSYIAPLPWRHTFTAFGTYYETAADVTSITGGGGFQPNQEGRAFQASGRYAVPLPRIHKYRHEVSIGYDFKRSNNDFLFGITDETTQSELASRSTTDIDQFVLGYQGVLADKFGQTQLSAEVFYSPGGFTEYNTDQDYATARDGAKADYLYTRLTLERATRLPWDFLWTFRVTGQIANANLLPSETLGMGGYSSLRGYSERVYNADTGYFLNTDLLLPALSHSTDIGPMTIRVLGFFDYGSGWYHAPNEFETLADRDFASAGFGARLTVGKHLMFRVDYGFQLLQQEDQASRVHIGLVARL